MQDAGKKTDKAGLAAKRQRRIEAMNLQAIECNPLDADDVAALERFAKAADRPPSWVARKVLCAWLKENALPAQPEEAEAAAREVLDDWPRLAKAARDCAVEIFDSAKNLRKILGL